MLGYCFIIAIIWSPEHLQRILPPIALVLTLFLVSMRRPSRDDLGVGGRGLLQSLSMLPAAVVLAG